jgi:hypothetical protein
MDISDFAVQDPELERQGRRLAAPGRWFVLLGVVLAIPGIVLVVVGGGVELEVGVTLILLALVPGVVALALLLSGAVARWAARHNLFA